ncbi:hypothetical protein GCM10009801_18680 [Streptomyces albiaxialis]|uniref:Lipoprotein n=1 Tax=Streptomyces albiaxialis TaxID=329523 RepID=A0ABN2VQ89_9ACTN
MRRRIVDITGPAAVLVAATTTTVLLAGCAGDPPQDRAQPKSAARVRTHRMRRTALNRAARIAPRG